MWSCVVSRATIELASWKELIQREARKLIRHSENYRPVNGIAFRAFYRVPVGVKDLKVPEFQLREREVSDERVTVGHRSHKSSGLRTLRGVGVNK